MGHSMPLRRAASLLSFAGIYQASDWCGPVVSALGLYPHPVLTHSTQGSARFSAAMQESNCLAFLVNGDGHSILPHTYNSDRDTQISSIYKFSISTCIYSYRSKAKRINSFLHQQMALVVLKSEVCWAWAYWLTVEWIWIPSCPIGITCETSL